MLPREGKALQVEETEAFDPRKPDPYELYEKSRAIYESRRK